MVTEAEYRSWVSHAGAQDHCVACDETWPKYLHLEDEEDVGSGALGTLQSYLRWKEVQCSVQTMDGILLHAVGDKRGRALFVVDADLTYVRSDNTRELRGYDYVVIPHHVCNPIGGDAPRMAGPKGCPLSCADSEGHVMSCSGDCGPCCGWEVWEMPAPKWAVSKKIDVPLGTLGLQNVPNQTSATKSGLSLLLALCVLGMRR
jgi:hypothetical protein